MRKDRVGRCPENRGRHTWIDLTTKDDDRRKHYSHVGADQLVQWSSLYRIMPLMNDHNEREAQLVTETHDAGADGRDHRGDASTVRRTAGPLKMLNRRLVRGRSCCSRDWKRMG
jgi:hypothetical protein